MKTTPLFTFLLLASHSFSQNEPDSVQTIPIKKEDTDEIMIDPDESPVFPGGTAALNQWLSRTIAYPPEAMEMGLTGKVYFKFVIEVDGTVTNIQIIRGVPDCYECDREALRTMKLMPAWIPAKRDGQPIRSYMMMPIIFNLQ